jgi:signal peptidase I
VPTKASPARRSRRLGEDAVIVAVAVGLAVLVRAFVAQAYWIPSGSMIPQLEVNDRVIVSRLAYHLHPVHRGDIIVFKSPPHVEPPVRAPSNPISRVLHDAGVALGFAQDQTVLIKRVIGLPGETVSASGGRVYIDGRLLVEPYLPAGTYTGGIDGAASFAPVRVPPGKVFVMGDNRENSEDSRFFGPIPESTIIGRAIWRVWPIWRPAFL